MNNQTAISIGRRITSKATAILVAVMLLILMIGQTYGDFANGILFFLEAVLTINTLVLLIIVFGLTYILGGVAAEAVIIKKKNFIATGIICAVIIALAISVWVTISGAIMRDNFSSAGAMSIIKGYTLRLFTRSAFTLSIVWVWSTYKMKSTSPARIA